MHPISFIILLTILAAPCALHPARAQGADSARVPAAGGASDGASRAVVPAAGGAITADSLGGGRDVIWWRAGVVGAAAVGTLGATYLYLQNTWWDENQVTFHFDDGPDGLYALNLDKMAHFYCGAVVADLFTEGLRWAHLSEDAAIWAGIGLSAFVQMTIELKDAYSPRWGFAVKDVASGIGGSLYSASKHYVPLLAATDVKFSYWRRSDNYFTKLKTDGSGHWNDDYINQTYWLSFKVNELLPSSLERWWPDWLALAVGWGVDETLTGWYDKPGYPSGQGRHECYIALDYDLTRILPSDNVLWETIKHYLNYLKLPAPAIRLTPSTIWYGLYF